MSYLILLLQISNYLEDYDSNQCPRKHSKISGQTVLARRTANQSCNFLVLGVIAGRRVRFSAGVRWRPQLKEAAWDLAMQQVGSMVSIHSAGSEQQFEQLSTMQTSWYFIRARSRGSYLPYSRSPMCIPITEYRDWASNTKICLNFRMEYFSLYSYSPLVLPSATTAFQFWPRVIRTVISELARNFSILVVSEKRQWTLMPLMREQALPGWSRKAVIELCSLIITKNPFSQGSPNASSRMSQRQRNNRHSYISPASLVRAQCGGGRGSSARLCVANATLRQSSMSSASETTSMQQRSQSRETSFERWCRGGKESEICRFRRCSKNCPISLSVSVLEIQSERNFCWQTAQVRKASASVRERLTRTAYGRFSKRSSLRSMRKYLPWGSSTQSVTIFSTAILRCFSRKATRARVCGQKLLLVNMILTKVRLLCSASLTLNCPFPKRLFMKPSWLSILKAWLFCFSGKWKKRITDACFPHPHTKHWATWFAYRFTSFLYSSRESVSTRQSTAPPSSTDFSFMRAQGRICSTALFSLRLRRKASNWQSRSPSRPRRSCHSRSTSPSKEDFNMPAVKVTRPTASSPSKTVLMQLSLAPVRVVAMLRESGCPLARICYNSQKKSSGQQSAELLREYLTIGSITFSHLRNFEREDVDLPRYIIENHWFQTIIQHCHYLQGQTSNAQLA